MLAGFSKKNSSNNVTDTSDNLSIDNFTIGTESMYSSKSNKQSGGFFWNWGNNVDINNVVLQVLKEGAFSDFKVLLKRGLVTDCNIKDSDNNTLLHLLAKNKQVDLTMEELDSLVKKCKKIINNQNKNGDTPILVAVAHGNDKLATVLDNNGADKSIKNKDGIHVDSEPCENKYDNQVEELPSFNQVGDDTEDTLGLSTLKMTETEVGNRFRNLSRQLTEGSRETEGFMESLAQKLENETEIKPVDEELIGGKRNRQCGVPREQDTDQFLNNLMNKYNRQTQLGGSKNKVTGTRKLQLFTEGQPTEEQDDDVDDESLGDVVDEGDDVNLGDSGDEDEGPTNHIKGGKRKTTKRKTRKTSRTLELSRMVDNQASIIHKKVLEKIKEVMDVDEETARDYKAGLWQLLKEKHPDLSTNLEKAMKLEEMVTKPNLKKIKLEDAKKLREENRRKSEERHKMRKERYGKKKVTELSATSESDL